MREFFLYVFYRAGLALLAALPLTVLFRLGRAVGFCAWLVLPKYRALAFRNTSIAFGEEKSGRELRRLVRQHFQRLGANLLSSLKLSLIPPEEMEKRIAVEN